jgi:NADH-quinone oxidoreductase subunit M
MEALILLLLPLLPLGAALYLTTLPREKEDGMRRIVLATTSLCLLGTLFLFLRFPAGAPGYHFVFRVNWLPSLGISYQVGVDGIGMTLVLLHALVSTAGAFVSLWIRNRVKEYLIFYLILVASIYGVFSSLDLFFLYLYYEMSVIPMYPLIGVWGSQNKEYASMKLTVYITTGAVLALAGILMIYGASELRTFDLIALREVVTPQTIDVKLQQLIAPFLLFGLGVIASLWPLHSWSPIGYAAAPSAVSMLHAGVLKKMGPYILIRLIFTFLPEGAQAWWPWIALLATVNILYAAFAAIDQKDLKFLIGFSSVSHMGYVLLGIASANETALTGTVFLMFSHGVMAASAFALAGYVYEQTHTRSIPDLGGLGKKLPFISTCFVMTALASAGVPGFSNFVSELLIFLGAWKAYRWAAVLAVIGILFTAVYLLRAVRRIFFGPLTGSWPRLEDAKTLFARLPFALLLGSLILFGFWPQGLLRLIQPSVTALTGGL